MSKADIINEHAPSYAAPRPDNPILESRAWKKMWLENNNVLWTVVGDTGDGKSYASFRIGEVIDPNFGIENIAFDIIEFIEKVVDDSFGQGSVVVLEEGSVEASSYDWHSESNRVFAKILDTWRHQNRMGIINLPNFMALEKGARRRTKGIVKMQHAAPWRDYSQAKYYDANYGNIEDQFTTPFPVINGKERRYIRFNLPREDLMEAYEKKKEEYTSTLSEDLLEQLLSSKEEEEKRNQSPQDIADDIIESGDWEQRYVAENHGQRYIDRTEIEVEHDVGDGISKKVKKLLEKEVGYDVM